MIKANKRKSWMELEQPYFYTATILRWQKLLKPDKYKQIVLDCLHDLVDRKVAIVYGFVFMPNHIHLLWELPKMNGKEKANASFLKFTAHAFEKDLRAFHPDVLPYFEVEKRDRVYQFWQHDALAIRLFNKDICEQKLHYTHQNPLQVHWQLAEKAENYFWSSAKFYKEGIDDFGFLTDYQERF